MSIQYGLPHLFQFGDLERHTATTAAELNAAEREHEAELTRDGYVDRELYGEEEGIRVLYQLSFLDED
jgi:hypothetical protein